jgi:hypothetical protein
MKSDVKPAVPNRLLRARYFRAFAIFWAVLAFGPAVHGLSRTSNDARWLVGVASILGPLCALWAAALIRQGFLRLAGALLVLSAATPTYFAWALNIPALVVGVSLLAGLQLTPTVSGDGQPQRPVFDFPPDTRSGKVFTIVLLTVANAMVPVVPFVWGMWRVMETKVWKGWQKVAIVLLLPGILGTPEFAVDRTFHGQRNTSVSE